MCALHVWPPGRHIGGVVLVVVVVGGAVEVDDEVELAVVVVGATMLDVEVVELLVVVVPRPANSYAPMSSAPSLGRGMLVRG